MPLDIEPMMPMSEDGSDSEESSSDDIAAFLPPELLPKKSTATTRTSSDNKRKSVDNSKLNANTTVPKPNNSRSQVTTSNVVNASRLRIQSPPSNVKPAKKRSKSIVAVSAAPLKRQDQVNNDNRKKASTPPHSSIKPAKKRSKSTVVIAEDALPPSLSYNDLNSTIETNLILDGTPDEKKDKSTKTSSLREMKAGARKSTVVMRGKENNKVERIGKTSKSMSMKQSLVRLQSESNLCAPNQGKKKKPVNMGRIGRLAQPRRQSTAHPSVTTSSPVKSVKREANMSRIQRLSQPRRQTLARPSASCPAKNIKRITASGPPSLLKRTAQSRNVVKSTAELEQEEMDRIKPFRAKKIGGSIQVPSRYKTVSKRPQPAITHSAQPSAKARPSTKSSTVYSRQSGLYKSTPSRKKVETFGESMHNYLNRNLRSSPNNQKPKKTATVKPPSVAFLQRRQTMSHSTVKSSEELELDECKRQFRAKSYNGISNGRRTNACYTHSTLSSEQIELAECEKQFK